MNPYEKLTDKAFWKPAVAQKNMFTIDNLWDPKFEISSDKKIVTFGSCFAQHIGKALTKRGFSWISTEPPPFGLSQDNAKQFNYNVFSCRTGNIYTTSLLKQWTEWALNRKKCTNEVWLNNNRYYDPFRPRIEPEGFKSAEEVRLSRKQAIKSFQLAIRKADYFFFTLGLTEAWFNMNDQVEYPMCPGTAAGKFNKKEHHFNNQQFNTVLGNLESAIEMMKDLNPNLRFIFTVSPVPLTATNSGNHVLLATMESKSILRSVAGELARNNAYIDYFPSYEIINSPVFRGNFFEPNQRSVSSFGVDFVMNMFFQSLNRKYATVTQDQASLQTSKNDERDMVCEEEILTAFSEQ